MKRKVCQIPIDTHSFKDARGKWIRDYKPRSALAANWQIDKLKLLGCKEEMLKGIRFHVANGMIEKLKKDAAEAARLSK